MRQRTTRVIACVTNRMPITTPMVVLADKSLTLLASWDTVKVGQVRLHTCIACNPKIHCGYMIHQKSGHSLIDIRFNGTLVNRSTQAS